MNQVSSSPKARKQSDGNGHHQSGHKQFSNNLRKLIADLQAAEELRAEELKRLRWLRRSVYADAARLGVKPEVLRAVLSLQKMNVAESAGGGR
jgi:hypothetical protein